MSPAWKKARPEGASVTSNADSLPEMHHTYEDALLRGLGIEPVLRLTYEFNGVIYVEAESAIRAAQEFQVK